MQSLVGLHPSALKLLALPVLGVHTFQWSLGAGWVADEHTDRRAAFLAALALPAVRREVVLVARASRGRTAGERAAAAAARIGATVAGVGREGAGAGSAGSGSAGGGAAASGSGGGGGGGGGCGASGSSDVTDFEVTELPLSGSGALKLRSWALAPLVLRAVQPLAAVDALAEARAAACKLRGLLGRAGSWSS